MRSVAAAAMRDKACEVTFSGVSAPHAPTGCVRYLVAWESYIWFPGCTERLLIVSYRVLYAKNKL